MQNTRAIVLMICGVAMFTVADIFVKLARETLSASQIMLVSSVMIGAIFFGFVKHQGDDFWHREAWNPALNIRSLGEVFGSFGILVAFGKLDFSTVSVLAQAQPLAVTLGAALFLGENVGWRRWLAVFLGFSGVLVVMRPTPTGFDPNMLWMLLFIIGLGARDLASRALPDRISTSFAVVWSMVFLTIAGTAILPFEGGWHLVSNQAWMWLVGLSLALSLAIWLLTTALRLGEVAAVAPFRYSRIPFALFVAWLFFDDVPDALTWLGCSMIIGSGFYAFWRERRLNHRLVHLRHLAQAARSDRLHQRR